MEVNPYSLLPCRLHRAHLHFFSDNLLLSLEFFHFWLMANQSLHFDDTYVGHLFYRSSSGHVGPCKIKKMGGDSIQISGARMWSNLFSNWFYVHDGQVQNF